MPNKDYFEWIDTYDILSKRIKEIEDKRDSLEQDYYRKKLALETEYNTHTAVLLSEKMFLRDWQRFLQETMIQEAN